MPSSDKDLVLLIGKLDGKLEGLISAFEDERKLARADRRTTLQKLEEIDRLHAEGDDLKQLVDQLQKQIYSTKAEVDKSKDGVAAFEKATNESAEEMKKDLSTLKTVYSKVTGIIVVFSALGTLILTGVTWVVSHPTEIFTFIKGLTGGKP